MKLKTIIAVLLFCILILNPPICFSQTDTRSKLVIEFNDNIPQKKEKNILQKYILPQVASIIALLSLLIGWFQLKKQIKATRKDILQQYNLEKTSLLVENISNLLLEIKQDKGNFAQGKHVSDNHFLCEKRIQLLLDSNNNLEKELSEYINSITDGRDNQETIQEAINNIEKKASIVINNKIKKYE